MGSWNGFVRSTEDVANKKCIRLAILRATPYHTPHMEQILRILMAALLVSGLGCDETTGHGLGDSSMGSDAAATTAPQTHILATDDLMQFAAGDKDGVLITLPAPGTIQYTVTDQSTTTAGSWDLGILAETQYQNFMGGGSWQGHAVNYAVNNKTATTSTLPAGNYLFVFRCRNLVDVCIFAVSLQDTY